MSSFIWSAVTVLLVMVAFLLTDGSWPVAIIVALANMAGYTEAAQKWIRYSREKNPQEPREGR